MSVHLLTFEKAFEPFAKHLAEQPIERQRKILDVWKAAEKGVVVNFVKQQLKSPQPHLQQMANLYSLSQTDKAEVTQKLIRSVITLIESKLPPEVPKKQKETNPFSFSSVISTAYNLLDLGDNSSKNAAAPCANRSSSSTDGGIHQNKQTAIPSVQKDISAPPKNSSSSSSHRTFRSTQEFIAEESPPQSESHPAEFIRSRIIVEEVHEDNQKAISSIRKSVSEPPEASSSTSKMEVMEIDEDEDLVDWVDLGEEPIPTSEGVASAASS